MLTLKELKKIVKVADMEKRIPSVKSLKEHKVVVKEMINADTTISVYDHGYVLYTAGNQSTVFPLHSCDDYEYVSVTGDNKEFNKEFFDNENWYIRLLMEAEDRMAYSQSKISTNHGVFSNSDVTDDAEIMRGSSKDFVDDVIDREILNALIKELTERQRILAVPALPGRKHGPETWRDVSQFPTGIFKLAAKYRFAGSYSRCSGCRCIKTGGLLSF